MQINSAKQKGSDTTYGKKKYSVWLAVQKTCKNKMKTEVNFHFALLTQLPSNTIQLVIVDTTAAAALYIVGQ